MEMIMCDKVIEVEAEIVARAEPYQSRDYGDHSERCLELAPYSCGNDNSAVCGEEPESRDHELSRADDDERYRADADIGNLHEHSQSREHEHLVRERVKKLAEVGDKVAASGYLAVEGVGNGRGAENSEGGEVVEGESHIHTNEEEGYQEYP